MRGTEVRDSANFLVMAKPAGPKCDLRCDYCYYVGNETAIRGSAQAGTGAPAGATAAVPRIG